MIGSCYGSGYGYGHGFGDGFGDGYPGDQSCLTVAFEIPEVGWES